MALAFFFYQGALAKKSAPNHIRLMLNINHWSKLLYLTSKPLDQTQALPPMLPFTNACSTVLCQSVFLLRSPLSGTPTQMSGLNSDILFYKWPFRPFTLRQQSAPSPCGVPLEKLYLGVAHMPLIYTAWNASSNSALWPGPGPSQLEACFLVGIML